VVTVPCVKVPYKPTFQPFFARRYFVPCFVQLLRVKVPYKPTDQPIVALSITGGGEEWCRGKHR